jgi:hypothetical protein
LGKQQKLSLGTVLKMPLHIDIGILGKQFLEESKVLGPEYKALIPALRKR